MHAIAIAYPAVLANQPAAVQTNIQCDTQIQKTHGNVTKTKICIQEKGFDVIGVIMIYVQIV